LITRAIFGEGAKDATLLGRGVYPQYGRGADGFDICSVQFAIHYFFENNIKLHTFLQNVSECTKLGGYFIGTCFDGARIFQALARLETGDEMSVLSSGGGDSGGDPQKMWSVRKKYHQTEFEPDSSSIGYEIEVYQDSINKATREYLVNFDYLTQLLENYGLDLVSPEEAATTLMFPMPDGTATFDGVFHQMELECKNKRDGDNTGGGGWSRRCQQEYGSALYMTPEEKQISFYNRYFIFRKNRNINAKQLKSSFLSYAGLQEEQDRGFAGAAAAEGEDAVGHIALEKIAKASRPIDVATKPAIAAHILAERATEKQMAALTAASSQPPAAAAAKTTLKIKPKPKNTGATTAKAATAAEPEVASSAPIEQIEKKIQKRTKKAKIPEENESEGAVVVGAAVASGKPKRQTKKKNDL
jgi:hypothetical protein